MKIKVRLFKPWFYSRFHFSWVVTSGEDATKEAKLHMTETYKESKRFDEVYKNLKKRVILRIWRAAVLFDVY